jgi:hypothetical protein
MTMTMTKKMDNTVVHQFDKSRVADVHQSARRLRQKLSMKSNSPPNVPTDYEIVLTPRKPKRSDDDAGQHSHVL